MTRTKTSRPNAKAPSTHPKTIASFVPDSPPEWAAAGFVTAAAAAEVGVLVLVGVWDVEVANVEDDELGVVLEELVILALLDVDEAVFEASDANIDVTSV
jgi:hypothetical protein